jgi:hypothetical protein
LSASFLARGAEQAGFGCVGGALSEQAVVGAQSFAAIRDANTAPRDGDALLFDGFGDRLSGLLFGLLGSLDGFLFSLLGSLFSFLSGSLFSLGGSLFSFLVGILGGSLFRLAGFFGSIPFSLFGGFAGFAFFLGEDGFGGLGFFGGFGGLGFFGFFGGSYLLDGVAVSVEFDDFRLGGLGDGDMFLESETDRGGFELSEDETTDSFAIEILTFAREHGNDDVDEFVTDLGSHVVRHFREALFHDRVRGKSHGSLGISGVH